MLLSPLLTPNTLGQIRLSFYGATCNIEARSQLMCCYLLGLELNGGPVFKAKWRNSVVIVSNLTSRGFWQTTGGARLCAAWLALPDKRDLDLVMNQSARHTQELSYRLGIVAASTA